MIVTLLNSNAQARDRSIDYDNDILTQKLLRKNKIYKNKTLTLNTLNTYNSFNTHNNSLNTLNRMIEYIK